MADQTIRSELQAEYLLLQKTIEDFDGRALTIKAWSTTYSLVAVTGAWISHASAALLVAAVSSLVFWLIEASWKAFQYAYYDRCWKIEEYFRGERTLDAPFQISKSWSQRWSETGARKTLEVLFWPHVALPHIVVVPLALILYLLVRCGVLALS